MDDATMQLNDRDLQLLATMELLMETIETVHDFISTCAYARELRGLE